MSAWSRRLRDSVLTYGRELAQECSARTWNLHSISKERQQAHFRGRRHTPGRSWRMVWIRVLPFLQQVFGFLVNSLFVDLSQTEFMLRLGRTCSLLSRIADAFVRLKQ